MTDPIVKDLKEGIENFWMRHKVSRLCRVRPFSAAMLKLRKFLAHAVGGAVMEAWARLCATAQALAQHLSILISYFSMMKSMQKSSRNEASKRPARIGRSLGSSPHSLIRAFPPSPARRYDWPPRPKNKRSFFLLYIL